MSNDIFFGGNCESMVLSPDHFDFGYDTTCQGQFLDIHLYASHFPGELGGAKGLCLSFQYDAFVYGPNNIFLDFNESWLFAGSEVEFLIDQDVESRIIQVFAARAHCEGVHGTGKIGKIRLFGEPGVGTSAQLLDGGGLIIVINIDI